MRGEQSSEYERGDEVDATRRSVHRVVSAIERELEHSPPADLRELYEDLVPLLRRIAARGPR